MAQLLEPKREGIVHRIVNHLEDTCMTCATGLHTIRIAYPTATELWAGLCEDHIAWARIYQDMPEQIEWLNKDTGELCDLGKWPGFHDWMRDELIRVQRRLATLEGMMAVEERLVAGHAFIAACEDEELLQRAQERMAKLVVKRTQSDAGLSLEALKDRWQEYTDAYDYWDVRFRFAKMSVPA